GGRFAAAGLLFERRLPVVGAAQDPLARILSAQGSLKAAASRPRGRALMFTAPAPGYHRQVAGIEQLVEELERSYVDLQERLSNPAVYNDHREAADVGRRLKELEAPHKLAVAWQGARADLVDARDDPELASLA